MPDCTPCRLQPDGTFGTLGPFLQKGGTSQLALLTEEAYAAGLERIKVDLLQAEKTGVPLEFVVDVSLALVTGSAP